MFQPMLASIAFTCTYLLYIAPTCLVSNSQIKVHPSVSPGCILPVHPTLFGPFINPKSKILEKNLQICAIVSFILLLVAVKIASYLITTVKYVPFFTRLNAMRRDDTYSSFDLYYLDIIILYSLLFYETEHFFIVLTISHNYHDPYNVHVCMLSITKKLLDSREFIGKMFKASILFNLVLCTRSLLTIESPIYIFKYIPAIFEVKAVLWLPLLVVLLSNDIEVNPGPHTNRDSCHSDLFSFCNWNLNTLSKDDFQRITLMEAHNSLHHYDIISLCETSLNDSIQVPENALPGYKFHSCNHPDGDRNGGVGIFFKDSLPLRIRDDLAFDEVIVSELIFGRKKIFFTVLYRNPQHTAQSEEFCSFLENLESFHLKIKEETPYAIFYAGDINGHS